MDELTAQRKTNELYSAVSNLVKRQNLEINKLSEKLNVKEDVIRNIMKEERPVAAKRRPSSAFDIYCAQRRIDGADKVEDVDAWLKLSSWDKTIYNQIADNYNHEQEYESVKYIVDEEKRKHTLSQSTIELKNLCRGINQECGYQFLIVGIEPNVGHSISFGTGNLKEFCYDRPATAEQIKDDLINYSKLKEQEKMIDDHEQDELESTVSSDLKSTNDSRMFMDSSDHEFTFSINESTSNFTSPISPKLTRNNSFDKKQEGDVIDYDDDKNFSHLITKDVCDVNLESTDIRSMVYRHLEKKFQQDTKQGVGIPYKDWNKQENFVISGWPRNVEFKEWDVLNINEKKKVFMALNRLQFHVRLDSDLSKERRASKKKRLV